MASITLEARIAARRAEQADFIAENEARLLRGEQPLPFPDRQPKPSILEQRIEERRAANAAEIKAREAIASRQNSMVVARLISDAITPRSKRKEVAELLGVKAPWLSKKMSLLDAPKNVQDMIENGELSEREYHTNRDDILLYVSRKKTAAREYKRTPTVTIGIDTAKTLAELLKLVFDTHGEISIYLDKHAPRKALASVLNIRSAEALDLMKRR